MAGGWTHLEIAGKPVDVFDPPSRPRCAVVYLHPFGLEMLVNNSAFTSELTRRNLACIAPHGQRGWWLDRASPDFDPILTNERFVLDHVVPTARLRWGIADRGLGVFGISMGGQGALRLAFRYPKVFPAAAGIASAIDFHDWVGQGTTLDVMFDSKEQARQDTATMHVHPYEYPPHLFFAIDPDDHPWFRGNDRLHEKLNALGVPHTIDFTTSAGGHSWSYFDRMAEPTLRFLADALDRESRRLM